MSVTASGSTVAVEGHVEGAERRRVPVDLPQRLGEGLGHADAAGLEADEHEVVEPVVVLEDLVGHPPDRPPHVVGVHDLAPGNKNAPVGGRGASFAFGHVPCPSCRPGLTGPA
jgi:hypothetical protein